MDEKTIKETLLKGERVTLECKKAKAEVPKSIWQTYSAFANTIGGLILLGVDEDLQVLIPHIQRQDAWRHHADTINFLLYKSSTLTSRSFKILARVSISGCEELVHQTQL